jgi:predicted transposase/invertase (TIGR01784 family)
MEAISPRVDIAFKKIFGVEENEDLLISLINSIVSTEDQVSEIILLNPYNPQNFKRDKPSVLDIKAKSKNGKRFNIEIQICDEADYDKRALYYWAKLYTQQLKISEDYSMLSKAIGIHILNFTSIPEVKKYHNVFNIREKETGIEYFKDLELHTIELKKFSDNNSDQLPELLAKIKNSLDIWAAFLTRHDLLKADNLPQAINDSSLKKAIEVLEVMNFNEEERDFYEDHLKWLRMETNSLKKAEEKGEERGIEKGIDIGIEIGEARGREEGIEIGEARGRIEGEIKKTKEFVMNLHLAGHSINLIAQVTKLTNEQIQEIIGELVCT